MELSALPAEAVSELKQLLREKASDLFAVCDQEEKGFVTKRDMQRMRSQLPELSPEQLEEAFGRLDRDGNGYLTLEEFADGFGEYLGLECADVGGTMGGRDGAELQMEEEPSEQESTQKN